MRAEHYVAIAQPRIGAGNDADDVPRETGLDGFIVGIHIDRDRNVVERGRRQRLARVRLCLDVRVLLPRGAEEELEEFVARGDLGWDLVVEALYGLKIAEAGASAATAASRRCRRLPASRRGISCRRRGRSVWLCGRPHASPTASSAAAAERGTRGTDRGDRVPQFDRVARASAEQAVLRGGQNSRPTRSGVNDDF